MVENNLSVQANSLINFINESGYICPWGSAWNKLYRMLPDKRRVAGEWEPPLPLIFSGWDASSNLTKSMLFREHIEWADKHGAIKRADKYLRDLEPGLWHRWQNSPYDNGD